MIGRSLTNERHSIDRQSPHPGLLFRLAIFLAAVTLPLLIGEVLAQDGDAASNRGEDAAMAAYADAANFQTNDALDLAIEAWQKFLKQYPDHEMASKAAHYLGVSYMQRDEPDYRKAAEAFRRALRDKDYNLREESLANLGWSLYAAAGDGQQRDEALLKQTLETFEKLVEENPKSRFLDRAYFYSAEAAYALGNPKLSIDYYNKLLSMSGAGESSLRDEALYGRGVAQEDLEQFDAAVESYQQLLESSDDQGLKADVQLRLGDLMILRQRHQEAVELFTKAYDTASSEKDQAYALFRKAYALVQSDNPAAAAETYQKLLDEHPNSEYAAAATLAAAQSTYRSGDLDLAAERFRRVLELSDPAAATEAAHWLARIHLNRREFEAAARVAEEQLESGAAGEFVTALRLDRAEALSMNPSSLTESLDLFEDIYRDAPQDPLAPRALYNAAFTALQINRYEKSIGLADEFLQRYSDHVLAPDVRFVGAESHLLAGQPKEASQEYEKLLESPAAAENSQRPVWLLRASAAFNAAQMPQQTIELLRKQLDSFTEDAQRAEANFLLGQAFMMSGQPSEAAVAYDSSRKADRTWARSDEAALLAGQALLASGDREAAVEDWQQLAESADGGRMADQARYKLAQLASRENDQESAIEYYDAILGSDQDAALRPYAMYGKGWSLMQLGNHDEAVETLDKMLADVESSHPLYDDALLARGISHRNLENDAPARRDLEALLELEPSGVNLGHALFELALVEQRTGDPAAAAEHLQRLVRDVSDYPSMDEVLYELGWSLREAGDGDEAAEAFASLVDRYPDDPLVAEAAFFVGQEAYRSGNFEKAVEYYQSAAEKASDAELSQKALYRLGWSHFKSGSLDEADKAFRQLAEKHSDGPLLVDALMMLGECDFQRSNYEEALHHYAEARERIRERDERASSLSGPSERRVREIVLLHGGQSAAQLERWEEAINWYDELRERFPATSYLSQVFYEIGYAHQQLGDDQQALKFYAEVANKYRNEVAARARFMMGEVHFGNQEYRSAIPEYQRVMFGFGAEKAPPDINKWQARSGFEAGRCAEMLMKNASAEDARAKAREIAVKFYRYVVEKHPKHELAGKSRERIEALKQT